MYLVFVCTEGQTKTDILQHTTKTKPVCLVFVCPEYMTGGEWGQRDIGTQRGTDKDRHTTAYSYNKAVCLMFVCPEDLRGGVVGPRQSERAMKSASSELNRKEYIYP